MILNAQWTLQGKTATVFGGTGFIGRYVVARLAKAGATVRVVTRHSQSAYFLRTNGVVGQVVPQSSMYRSEQDIDALVAGSDLVVNCLGVLVSKKRGSFQHMHVDLPRWIAQACAKYHVSRLVHLSALVDDQAASHYAASKRDGEKAVLSAFPSATILRPSVVFGPEDKFFNLFAKLARVSPVMPLIGGGQTKFQPVYVADVADAVMTALCVNPNETAGRVYELAGPEVVTFRDVYERVFAQTGVKRRMMTLPWGLARLQAAFLSVLPTPPLTGDQVTGLQSDSVARHGALVLSDLGIQPTAMDSILPTYLDRFRPGGRFAEKKRV